MGGDPSGPTNPNEVGSESRENRSSWLGGGRVQPYLSAQRFSEANEGSRDKRHPVVWAAGWVGAVCLLVAVFILIVR